MDQKIIQEMAQAQVQVMDQKIIQEIALITIVLLTTQDQETVQDVAEAEVKVLLTLMMTFAALIFSNISLGIMYNAHGLVMLQIHAQLIYQYGMKLHALANAASH